MTRILTDEEIADLIDEAKVAPGDWARRITPRPKRRYQYDERQLEVTSAAGHNFRFIARTNRQNPLDFSIILVFEDEDGSDYRLARFNGRHASRHTNRWEKRQGMPNHTFDPQFHIHRATERYQVAGYAIDGYAEVTDTYADFNSALDAFASRCGVQAPDPAQQKLF